MRITKVYTKTGDRGTTRLVGNVEVAKDDPRIEAYGTVDELNSQLGLARALLGDALSEADAARVDAVLGSIQNDLFDVGAELATRAEDRWPAMVLTGDDDARRLERWIDAFNDEVPPLKEFVLPAGGAAASTLHIARTVCRRAERRVVTLRGSVDDVEVGPLIYLNRLSDLLFVLARWVARTSGEGEVTWAKRG